MTSVWVTENATMPSFSHFGLFLVLVLTVISVDSDRRGNAIASDRRISDVIDVFVDEDGSLQSRDKRTIGTLLSGVADLFG